MSLSRPDVKKKIILNGCRLFSLLISDSHLTQSNIAKYCLPSLWHLHS